ncbi:uncharacterized protein EV422DRAFT_563955 [Fimicolochytrium jonesii]|uniref:uncharacterized protein n=1 Tax=Fimicolochytrium jonesii TaxID=1396493 RepID=UPI0022FF1F57|nr:uncharacterized protein EV422DRAFT_563955 [Fimicolochytrium jonesii]KAI8826140.1 hypothetical protein EV422DRAFT_563955 [Fimicolochytrium jonesii]
MAPPSVNHPSHKTSRFSPRVAVAAVIVLTLLYLALPHNHHHAQKLIDTIAEKSSSLSSHPAPEWALTDDFHADDAAAQEHKENQAAPACRTDYVRSLQDAAQNPTNKPQLSFEQLLWIATTVQTSAYALTTRGGIKRDHRFLVWGLGHDSPLWDNANCFVPPHASPGSGLAARRGRTAFVENWQTWIDTVSAAYPSLEVHFFDKYTSTVATSDAFFASPTSLQLPEEVQNVCWDVILVDAPQGYQPDQPGRHEATHWSVQKAKDCLRANKLSEVHIFLHDVNRALENKIVDNILRAAGGTDLGRINGVAGDLVAFRFTKASLVDDLHGLGGPGSH